MLGIRGGTTVAAQKRIEFRGHLFNQRTIDMIKAAEQNLKGRLGNGFELGVTQGSFSKTVQASALTHAGGGAADFHARTLPTEQRAIIVFELRRVGFAAWLRGVTDTLKPIHIHAVAVGDPELSQGPASAQAQVDDYLHNKNGLKGHGKDTGPRDFVGRTFEQFRAMTKLRESIKEASPNSSDAEKKADVSIRVRAVRMAAQGKRLSDTFLFDAQKFLAFASSGIKVFPVGKAAEWSRTQDPRIFVAAVKAVQKKFKLLEDGDPGPVTMGRLAAFGYVISP